MNIKQALLAFLVIVPVSVFAFYFALAAPNGAIVTPLGSNSMLNNATPENNTAYAGNVTELSITGVSLTQSWQGYFGNITGTIQLANSNGKVLYNWSVASPKGEVYASTNSTILWVNIQCFNFTAKGTFTDESGAGGTTNLNGLNLTRLQQRFNISVGDVDAVNETFRFIGTGGHASFMTGTASFSTGECPSTRIFDATGAGVEGEFEEVLLYEPVTTSVVFASLIENNTAGFDGGQHDFQMIVLENGHFGDTETTTYFFFVELQ